MHAANSLRRRTSPCIICQLRAFTSSSPVFRKTLKKKLQQERREQRTPQEDKRQRALELFWKDLAEGNAGNGKLYGSLYDRNPGKTAEYGGNGTKKRQMEGRRPQSGLSLDRLADMKIKLRVGLTENTVCKDPLIQRSGMSSADIKAQYVLFKRQIELEIEAPQRTESLIARLREAVVRYKSPLEAEIKYAFYGFLMSSQFSKAQLELQESVADMQHPQEWFPETRGLRRQIHVHVGPTNSGKTYHALQRLEKAERGVYAGPLRLLANEIFMRLNAKGLPCNLVTGDERRATEIETDGQHLSCTVEMVPLNTHFDVAVIDEIQMLGSEDRGWAWTQALLGIMANEVHLCGEERSIPIVQQLVAACGDELHIHRYERLTPLRMLPKSLNGNLHKLQKGDCVVAFSIVLIHTLRQEIEKATGKRCAVIYGSLPPETRTQQANLFNDPDNEYDFLVASNAVGMGLNLNIKRLIFQSAQRMLQSRPLPIPVAEIKQIAGRAGRYSTAAADISKGSSQPNSSDDAAVKQPNRAVGFVSTLEKYDYGIIKHAMEASAPAIPSAGLYPPAHIVERFAQFFPSDTPFSYLLLRLSEIAKQHPRYHLCDLRENMAVADAIEEARGLTISDRLTFVAAPIDSKRKGEAVLALSFAKCVAERRPCSILDFADLKLELLEDDYNADQTYLRQLELLHRGVILFIWLSFRFTAVFIERGLAIHVRELIEKRFEELLQRLSFDYARLRKTRQKAIRRILNEAEQVSRLEGLDHNGAVPEQSIDGTLVPVGREKAVPEGETLFTTEGIEEVGDEHVQATKNMAHSAARSS